MSYEQTVEYLSSPDEQSFVIHGTRHQHRLGLMLRLTRVARGLTQKEMGRTLGLSQARISQLENGTYDPSLFLVARIVQVCGAEFVISPDLGEADYTPTVTAPVRCPLAKSAVEAIKKGGLDPAWSNPSRNECNCECIQDCECEEVETRD